MDEAGSPPPHPINASHSQMGVMGDNAHIEGGIHFHSHTSPGGKPLQRPPQVTYFTDRNQELAKRLALKPLNAADAVALLRRWAGDQAADSQAVEAICERLGYLPLAVRLAGRYLAETGQPAAEYRDWLQATPLEALDQGRRRLE